MAKKAKESRFQLHDELTAPDKSLPVLKGALSTGGQVSNMLGLLAGAPSVLRAYARFRSELRQGALPLKTQQRVALAVAQHEGSEYVLVMLQRTARDAGLGLDEIALARQFDSADRREATLLAFVKGLLDEPEAVPLHLVEEAREADWTDEQLLETTAHVSLGLFHALFTRGGNLPIDGSAELGRVLRAA
ncbi:MAG TPA: carboxymuconolactone decarboxylase family protein [Thermoleophilaceae bacterium]